MLWERDGKVLKSYRIKNYMSRWLHVVGSLNCWVVNKTRNASPFHTEGELTYILVATVHNHAVKKCTFLNCWVKQWRRGDCGSDHYLFDFSSFLEGLGDGQKTCRIAILSCLHVGLSLCNDCVNTYKSTIIVF